MTKSQNTKNEQQKDLCVTSEQQVWKYPLSRALELQAENEKLKELLARAKGIITAYRLTGNQSTYSDNDMKECVAKIDEVLR